MTPSMFPALFIFFIIFMGLTYLVGKGIFRARREKKQEELNLGSVQDWKNFFRKLGPVETGKWFFKNEEKCILTNECRHAFHQMYHEWFGEGVEDSQPDIH